jgi:homoserine O-succinyltransferase/O-acetyltransferase
MRMPVLVAGDWPDHHSFGPSTLHSARARLPGRKVEEAINIGIVNNMPDSALIPTERQLFKLLAAAAGNLPVHLWFYSLPNPRSAWAHKHLARSYSTVDDLWIRHLDGLIVTGAEPQTPDLTDEPYWSTLTRLIDWAQDNTTSAIWSCLAVHAAVLHCDGIDRHSLHEKCIGVFEQESASGHPLMKGVPSRLRMPHSRWNEVRENALTSHGYSILTRSEHAGVDMFVKQEKSLFVFFQGHPEYEANTLLGEYRRDIGRFLRKEMAAYPVMPLGYFDAHAEKLLSAFRERAHSDQRKEVLAKFPVDLVAANLKSTWQSEAVRIYRNWLLYISEQRTVRRRTVGHSFQPVSPSG